MNIEVLRIDGSREKHEAHKTGAMGVIHRLIGASCCDTVNLRNGMVMIVDDTGMVDVRPRAHASASNAA